MLLDDISELSRGSNEKVLVLCDFQESQSCLGHVIRRYVDVHDNMDRNNGKYVCKPCSRFMKFSGRSNLNCKHRKFDDHLMDIINSKEKHIFSDGSLRTGGYAKMVKLALVSTFAIIEFLKFFATLFVQIYQ